MLSLGGRRAARALAARRCCTTTSTTRKTSLTRRTRYELAKAEERAHILEGLLIALDNIDEVIHIIRSSQTDKEAAERLTERFGLDEEADRRPSWRCACAASPAWSARRSRTSWPSCIETHRVLQARAGRRPSSCAQIIKEELHEIKKKLRHHAHARISPRRRRTSTSRTSSPRRTWWSP